MNNTISFSKNIYTKNAIHSSIKEWKDHLDIKVISEDNNYFVTHTENDDYHKIQEFLNYVLDKSSLEEIAQ